MKVVDAEAVPVPARDRRRRATGELVAAGLTLAAWVASKPLGWHIPYILCAIAAWGAYCACRLVRGRRAQVQAWGFLPERGSWWPYAAFTLAAVAVVVVAALARGITWPTLPPLAWPVYVGWAFAQQFAIQGIVVAGLLDFGASRRVVPLVVGVVFAAAHLPVWPLALLAGTAGVVWTRLHLSRPNLWAVGLSHAVVGSLALVLLLGQNPVGGFYGVPLK